MYSIRLVNMPFAAIEFPSLALSQLKSVLEADYRDRVDVQIGYANHDFATRPGLALYQELATSVRLGMTGIGEWLFRQAAFPELADNAQEYFARCFPGSDPASKRLKRVAQELRPDIDRWLGTLIQRFELDQADLVGCTSMFAQNLATIALARKLKELRPGITIVMGGANCEFPMGWELIRHIPAVDFVFSGPALRSFSDFVGRRLAGDDAACHRIDGVLSRHNAPRAPAQTPGDTAMPPLAVSPVPVVGVLGAERDINDLVALDYEDFLQSVSRWPEIKPSLLFETSRGCWWGERAHCTFCGLNGLTMKYRSMSPASALRQFDDLFRYAARLPRLSLQCVDNIMPREYLTSVLPNLVTPANVDIFYEVKSDLCDAEVAALAEAGVRSIQPGIESLATSTLRRMRKGTTAFHGVSLLKQCQRHGIVPQWNLLIGFPGEPASVYEKYQRDLPLLFHLPPPTGVFPVRFDRFSPYFADARTFGLDLRPFDFYELIYPFDGETLRQLAYFFIDNNFQSDYFVQMVHWIGPLSQLVADWRRRYEGLDGRERAELSVSVHHGEAQVADTRSGRRQSHRLSPIGGRLIRALDEPLDRMRLAAQVGTTDDMELERELTILVQRGYLFEESGRWLSLVQPGL